MVWRWSKTAASNSTADSTINWAEGQAPSSINDSARAEMARVAQWRDDISGTIATGGTSTAYTVTSNQVFDTLAHMDAALIAFVPHTTSGAAPTLNVDGLGAKKIRFQTGIDIPDGVLVQGTPYVVTYGNSASEFILHNLAGNPYSIPLGGGIDYWGTTAPNSAFAFPYGQAISRTTYASAFSLFGTTYGSGDGSTTFNVPDKRNRLSIPKGDMGGVDAARVTFAVTGIAGATLGASGGSQSHTLTAAQLPVITPTFTGASMTSTSNDQDILRNPSALQVSPATGTGAGVGTGVVIGQQIAVTGTPTGTVSSFGSGNAHPQIPPAIICNYIIRII